MCFLKKNKVISTLSVVLSLIGIAIGTSMQHCLYIGYQIVTRKTQALSGLKQLAYLEYTLFGIGALLLSLISLYKKEQKNIVFITFSLSILSILIFVFEIWRLFI